MAKAPDTMRVSSTNQQGGKSRRHSWAWRLLVLIVFAGVLVFLGWLSVIIAPKPGDAGAKLPVSISPELIQRGAYLAWAGDCGACHTKPGAEPFSGGLAIASPVGGMVPPNITPDRDFGIGSYSYGDFVRAVRYGVNPKGQTLYPAMPWTSYAKVSDEDLQALYAYFMQGVKPVARKGDDNSIAWPLSMRWPVTYWRWLFGPGVSAPATAPESGLALGAYYVEGLGHCGACHTPRAFPTLQEEVLDNSTGTSYLAGGQVIDGYPTPSLRSEPVTGLGGRSAAEIAKILKTGRAGRNATFGGMSQVVHDSTSYMTDADLLAMGEYLKSLAPHRQEEMVYYSGETFSTLSAGIVEQRGAKTYAQYCSGCHLDNGLGYKEGFPGLAQNPAIAHSDPAGLIRIVLAGQGLPDVVKDTPAYQMPAFAGKLDDAQIADVLSFIRTSWGNTSSAVSAGDVAKVRKSLPR